jgi:hypothetical protein
MIQDVSKVKIPEDFKFSPLLDGRGRGYQCVVTMIIESLANKCTRRVSWWMAQEIGVSPIPLGDVCRSSRSVPQPDRFAVLLCSACSYWRCICSFRFLQGRGYPETGGSTATEAEGIHIEVLNMHYD